MRTSVICLMAIAFVSLFPCPGYSGNIEKAGELGDDFQRQMPWSKEEPRSGEPTGQPQPENYVAPPERERNAPVSPPLSGEYPICYNPYTRAYENCYPEGSENWRLRYNSPDFRLWWESGRSCPPGYYFRPGRGCYRY